MKKFLFFVILIGAASWWYLIGGRQLSEENINEFYRELELATLDRKPDAICDLLAENFESTGTMEAMGQTTTQTTNRAETCDSYAKLYESFKQLGTKTGGIVQIDAKYRIHSINITPDRKSAMVDLSHSFDVAGTVMHIRSRSTDTLIRRNGKVLMLRSEGTGRMWTGL